MKIRTAMGRGKGLLARSVVWGCLLMRRSEIEMNMYVRMSSIAIVSTVLLPIGWPG